jgi:hypothetical protein
VEGSLDGADWSEIDRQTGHDKEFGSFLGTVSDPRAFRFVRITEPTGAYRVSWSAVEFFGTLFE